MLKDRCLGTMACFFLHCIENDLQTEGEKEREHRTNLAKKEQVSKVGEGI